MNADKTTEMEKWYAMPPRLGADEDFAAARELFAACGFETGEVCARLGVSAIHQYLMRNVNRPDTPEPLPPVEDALGTLIRLYIDCRYVEDAILARFLPSSGIAALEALNLLVREDDSPELRYSPSAIYPAGEILTACDRSCGPDGAKSTPPSDALYPAVFENTLHFVARIPRDPCDAMLDIGTGTGIAAIAGAATARHVWATDITPRSVLFADFNRRLAGVQNISVVEGDLYAPVEGLTFDRIVCHPPYIPSKTPKYIFREGGEDGEQILRGVIQGLPRFLRPNGTAFVMVLGSDREGEDFEQRLRKWLGPGEAEFDLVLVSDTLRTPSEYLTHQVGAATATPEEAEFLRHLWVQTKTSFLFYGSVLIRRHGAARPAFTVRTQAGVGFEPNHMQWVMTWERRVREPGGVEMLLASRPTLAAGCELRTLYRAHEGRLAPQEFSFSGTGPFKTQIRCEAWLAQTIAECDGSQSWAEKFEKLQSSGAIPRDVTPEQFAPFLSALVANCILHLGEIPVDV